MSLQAVPTATLITMSVTLLLSLGLPLALLVLVRKRTGASLLSALWGALTFALFALALEGGFHNLVLGSLGTKLTGKLFLYALYGGAAAAVFEECGRLFTMRFLMKKTLNRPNALMYGVGHGGIEAILITGMAYVSNLASAIAINSGKMEGLLSTLDEATRAATLQRLSALWTTPSGLFLWAGVERIAAIALHIALSLLVYRAVRERRWRYLGYALLFHFLVDALSVLMSAALPIWALELIVAALVAGIWWFVLRLPREDPGSAETAPSETGLPS